MRNVLRSVARRVLGPPERVARTDTWAGYTSDALQLADVVDCTLEDLAAPQQHPERVHPDWRTWIVNWYMPPFESAYYGGAMTILRFAAHMRGHGVRQRILICGEADVAIMKKRIAEPFPSLADADVIALNSGEAIANIPHADISFATLWTTAYVLLRVRNAGLKFYFMQDYEPLFYPAGTTYAQAELTYRFGFYGIGNTQSIRDIYVNDYGGRAHALAPSVDPKIFRLPATPRAATPLRLFYYARPGTPRNGFELAACALRRLKQRMGEAVEIDCAGAAWKPEDYGLGGLVNVLGMLPYDQTAGLYQRCHVGLVMMMTRHPSYLPFELMACGALVVSNQNDANRWLLKAGENCLLAPASATALAETLQDALVRWDAHAPLRERAHALVVEKHCDWTRALEAAFDFVRQAARSPEAGTRPAVPT